MSCTSQMEKETQRLVVSTQLEWQGWDLRLGLETTFFLFLPAAWGSR